MLSQDGKTIAYLANCRKTPGIINICKGVSSYTHGNTEMKKLLKHEDFRNQNGSREFKTSFGAKNINSDATKKE